MHNFFLHKNILIFRRFFNSANRFYLFFLCKDNANERNENLFSNCRVQLILCKDNANERNENLFSNCRVQLILCKDKQKNERTLSF